MARNYDRGYSPELAARKVLTERGFATWRAHASKGPFDLYAARPDLLLLIQVKRTKSRIVSPQAVATLCKHDLLGDEKKVGLKDIPVPAGVVKQVWLYSDRCTGKDLAGWRYYLVDGDRLHQVDDPVRDCRWENLAAGLMGGEQP